MNNQNLNSSYIMICASTNKQSIIDAVEKAKTLFGTYVSNIVFDEINYIFFISPAKFWQLNIFSDLEIFQNYLNDNKIGFSVVALDSVIGSQLISKNQNFKTVEIR